MEIDMTKICLDVFIDHWQQILYSINHSDDSNSSEIIFKHVDIMVSIIIKECDGEKLSLEDILEYCDVNSIFQTIFIHFNRDTLKGNNKEYGIFNQLRMYDDVLNFLPSSCLMRHNVLSPLLRLLEECSLRQSVKIEHLSVRLLYQLTVLVTRDLQLFKFVKEISSNDFHESLYFVGLIIQLIHRDKDIGRLSQEALLLIFNYTKDEDSDVVDYICYRSDFSAILATSLSGLYSSFPRKLENLQDDWQQITVEYIMSITDLKHSLELLDFCNLTLKMAHPRIQLDILDYLYTGFLSPVIGPSLHQNSLEETISATAYLELFLRHLHHPSLTRLFLQFIVMEKQDNYIVLDSLINRLNSLTMLGVVTLSLFKTMLSFHCEDVMFHLIFKYLIPCDHVIKQNWAQNSLDSSTEDLSQCATKQRTSRFVVPSFVEPNSAINENLSNSAEQFLKLSFGTFSDDENDDIINSSLMHRINQVNSDLRRASQSPVVLSNLQRFSSVSPFYSYLHSSALYVNRRILASNSWVLNYDGINPPAEIFEIIENADDHWKEKFPFSQNIKQSNETIQVADHQKDPSSPPEVLDTGKVKDVGYYSSNNGSGSIVSNKVVTSQPLDDSEEDGSLLNRLCDPSPSSKAIYKLNYFSFDPELIDTNCAEADKTDIKDREEQVSGKGHDYHVQLDDINMENVLLTTHEDCILGDFIVSLDLLEVHQRIEWEIDWTEIMNLLTEHRTDAHEDVNRRSSSTSVSPIDAYNQCDLSSSRSTPTNEVIFKERLQSFDHSIYISPTHSKFSITLGPFLTALFQRLRSLSTNTVFMNLLITGIITDLASYPHPLTKSLILDIDIILQPHISKLYNIIMEVKDSLLVQSSLIPNWETVLVNAYEYLYSRIEFTTQRSTYNQFNEEEFDIRLGAVSRIGSINSSSVDYDRFSLGRKLSTASSPSRNKKARKMSFGLLTRKKKKDEAPSYRFSVHKFCYSKKKQVTEADAQQIRNLAYGWVIFDEFCKELASLCQEHTQHCFF